MLKLSLKLRCLICIFLYDKIISSYLGVYRRVATFSRSIRY